MAFFPIRLTRRRLKVLVLLTAAGVLLWLLLSLGVAYHFTRRSRPPFAEPVPALSWAKVANHRLTTSDGETLGAWFMPGAAKAPSVLLLHGNGNSRQGCLAQAEIVAGAGCATLLISLRAHGDSTGDFNDFGRGARQDVLAAVRWLEQRRPGRPILVYGRSLGSAAAVFAAGELGRRVRGYLLESPFQDLRTAVRHRTAIFLPPVLDWIAATGLNVVAPLVIDDVDQISPLESVGQIPREVPVLILAGGADRRATPEEARAIYERIEPHARLVIFPGADHEKLIQADPERYRKEMLDWVKQTQVEPRR